MEIKCPKCSESFEVATTAAIPKEQTLYMSLESESDLFCAESIGKAIINMEKCLSGVAKNMGEPVVVFLHSVEMKPKHIKIGFQIVATKS